MDKATLLLAAGHTLGRKLVPGLLGAAKGLLMALGVIALAVAGLASMFIAIALATMPFAYLPRIDSSDFPDAHFANQFFLGPHGLTPAAWAAYACASALAFAALHAWARRDGSLAMSRADSLTRLNGWIMPGWFCGGRAFVHMMRDSGADESLACMAKIILLGLSMPIQSAVLAWTFSSSLALRLWWALRALGRRISGAGAALERLAQESPEIIARAEAHSLDASAKPADSDFPPPRL